jgi:prepilin-type processing-associated H-X9-DG protein
MVHILPQIEQDMLFTRSIDACRTDSVPWHNPPHVGFSTVIREYVCPAEWRLDHPIGNSFGVSAAYTSYIGVGGKLGGSGVLGNYPGIRLTDIADGTSQTLMVGERPPPDTFQAGRWYSVIEYYEGYISSGGPDVSLPVRMPARPGDTQCARARSDFGPGRTTKPCDRYHFWSLHFTGANFLFADGSARMISYSAAPSMPALATRAGGEVVSEY